MSAPRLLPRALPSRQQPRRRRPAALGRKRLPLSENECRTITLLSEDLVQKAIAMRLGVSISTVGTVMGRVYKKLDVHGPAAAALLHRDVHAWCGTRTDFGPILERIKALQSRGADCAHPEASQGRAVASA